MWVFLRHSAISEKFAAAAGRIRTRDPEFTTPVRYQSATPSLTGRFQSVMIHDRKPCGVPVVCDIPQGPLLFIIYTNDLDSVNSNLYMFADDSKIARHITNRHDSYELQHDLGRMQDWSNHWLLNFNPGKCKVISLGAFDSIVFAHRYSIYGQQLEHVESENDLAIIVDATFKFKEHIHSKIKLANSMMGLIRRVFSYFSPNMFKSLSTSLVRIHLESAQLV